MKRPNSTAPQLAWAIAAVSGATLVAGIILGGLAMLRAGNPIGLLSHQLTVPFSGLVVIPLGALVLARQPRHPVAWMLSGVGLLSGIEMLNLGVLVYSSLQAPGEIIPAPALSHWLAQWIWAPRGLIPLTILLLLFPDGALPSPRWRIVAWITAFSLAGTSIAGALMPDSWEALGGIVTNPFGVQSPLVVVIDAVSGLLLTVSFFACLASVLIRFRRSKGIARLQLKWMAYVVSLVLATCVAMGVLAVALQYSRLAIEIAYGAVNLTSAGVAFAVAIAVRRYRLYDIDIIINRTLVYSIMTLLVVAAYVLVVGSLSAIFQTTGNLAISLVATGLIAVLFQPVRERLQLAANRLLYGERDEPYQVLSRIGRNLEGATGPDNMLAAIVDTVAGNLKLPYVAISLSKDGHGRAAYETGRRPVNPVSLPLHYGGRLVGQLLCAPRGAGEAFTELEAQLLQDIANQAAVAIHAYELSAALQQSREQLVTAREEERRRLRRDLHDGLGPQLASLGLKLDAARNHLPGEPEVAEAILLELRRQVQDAISDIRRLVYNLRPPALDELGLLPALRASAEAQTPSGAPRVTVEGPSALTNLPAAVEVAAYRIAQEAVTNIARHAQASHCMLRLRLNDGLELEIADDGIGLPADMRVGVGLSSMRERTDELGGTFLIESPPEGGTRVIAHFPLTSHAP